MPDARWHGLITDGALFPPGSATVSEALAAHTGHRYAWYSPLVGPLACNAARLPALQQVAVRRGLGPVDVAVVVSRGLDEVEPTVAQLRMLSRLVPVAVEVPLHERRIEDAVSLLAPLVRPDQPVHVEIELSRLTERTVHLAALARLGLKLRVGGTSIDAFVPEAELGAALVRCAAESIAFTCAGGLTRAVRHRDADTLYEQHGFGNLILATQTATATASAAATARVLAVTDSADLGYRLTGLSRVAAAGIRAQFRRFASAEVARSVEDLAALRQCDTG